MDMNEFIEKAYAEGNLSVWEYEKYKEEFKEPSAQELFKKLGYEYKNYDGYISYEKKVNNTTHMIAFDNRCHTITKHQISDRYLSITLQELKAINKQIEELGWYK